MNYDVNQAPVQRNVRQPPTQVNTALSPHGAQARLPGTALRETTLVRPDPAPRSFARQGVDPRKSSVYVRYVRRRKPRPIATDCERITMLHKRGYDLYPPCDVTDPTGICKNRTVDQTDSRETNLVALKELLRSIHGNGGRKGRRPIVPSGLSKLDAALPKGGLPTGAIAEILHQGDGAGAMSLAVRFARRAASFQRYVVFITPPTGQSDLYPPGLVQAGLSPEQMVVARAASPRDAIWACEQSLRCPDIAAVIIHHGGLDHTDARVLRRLQLAAEHGGGIGLMLRSLGEGDFSRSSAFAGLPARGARTFAAVQLQVECLLGNVLGRPLRLSRIHVLKPREGKPVEPVAVDLSHETGDVPFYAPAADRTAGAPERLASA